MKETIFCITSAFILYEVSGIIGKEMLADKHITGEGKGYCDITFGKESKKSLEYYGAAEPPVRCGESHLSGLTEPLRSL